MRTAGIRLKGGTCTTDRGSEFNAGKPGIFQHTVTSFGLIYSALPSGRPAVHVESANKEIRTNINSRLAAIKSKNWVRLVSKIVNGWNNTSFTDWRAPRTPLEIVQLSPQAQVKLAKETYVKKKKRNQKLPGAKLARLKVGSWVRIALEGKVKGAKMAAKGPKQKWSSKSYEITKVTEKTEMYTLGGLPKRRFARYWLQPIPGKEDYAGPGIKERGTSTYKGGPPKPEPDSKVEAIRKNKLGSRDSPFPSKRAALDAGHKRGDHVYWKMRSGKPKRL